MKQNNSTELFLPYLFHKFDIKMTQQMPTPNLFCLMFGVFLHDARDVTKLVAPKCKSTKQKPPQASAAHPWVETKIGEDKTRPTE